MSDMHTRFHVDNVDNTIVVNNSQDVEPILDSCRLRTNEGAHGSAEMRHAATLPMVVIENYCNQHGISFQDWLKDKTHVKRMLNDPDLKGFRVWQGRV